MRSQPSTRLCELPPALTQQATWAGYGNGKRCGIEPPPTPPPSGRQFNALLQTCYPPKQPRARDAATLWARILLLGHFSFAVACISCGHLLPPLLLSLGPFACGFLFFSCNSTQHVGLHHGVADFRLNTRTFIPCGLIRFLYWHMNWHTEHHMYSAVPCYNLSKLHAAIRHDLPPPTVGIIETWKPILRALEAEAKDPLWRAVIALPSGQRKC